MNVEYSRRSLNDLRAISSWSLEEFGSETARRLETRIQQAIEQIRNAPLSAPSVENRPGVRVIALVRHPYRIFYRVTGDTIRILHIRHTARRSW